MESSHALILALAFPSSVDHLQTKSQSAFPKVFQHEPQGLGFGIYMGSPTGIAAINAALRTGYSTQQLYLNWNTQSDQIRLVTDQTWVFYEFPSDENLTFPLYWGMRGWANLNQVSTGLGLEGISQEMGIGLPLGITMYHKKAAIDLYFEFAPVLQLLPSTLFSFQSGVGFRMYPKLPTLRKRK